MEDRTITELLEKWSNGDKSVQDELYQAVYAELYRLAKTYMRKERAGHTLQPTALINEAFMKLVDYKKVEWQSRAHFYGVAARIMKNFLVDYARQGITQKRGGGAVILPLEDNDASQENDWQHLIELDDALERLAKIDPTAHRVIELRYFAGLTIEETAEVLKIGTATVSRSWNFAKAWLQREIGEATNYKY